MNAKVLFCITRAYQAKLPAWGEPAQAKTSNKSASTQAISNVPAMPNEHVSEAHSRPRLFDGFLL